MKILFSLECKQVIFYILEHRRNKVGQGVNLSHTTEHGNDLHPTAAAATTLSCILSSCVLCSETPRHTEQRALQVVDATTSCRSPPGQLLPTLSLMH